MKQLEERGQTIHWLKSIFSPRRTLLIIDMQVGRYLLCIYSVSTKFLQNIYNYIYIQNDFVSGSLAVPGAEDILDMVEDLSKLDIWYQVFYTQVTGYLPSNIYNIYTMIQCHSVRMISVRGLNNRYF